MVILSYALGAMFLTSAIAQQTVPVPRINPTIAEQTPPARGNKVEPARVYQSACPAVMNGKIGADILPPIAEDECGERSPLAVFALQVPEKIKLSSTPQINCRTATALADWTTKLNAASQAAFDTRVATILTGNGYQCRRRNNLPDGKISEHGFANAIDILGFKLENGMEILVERDWGEKDAEPGLAGLFLRTIQKQACENFTTVLGPDTNEYHKDHFHYDLGCHGKGCTYMICE